jgi:hypothetical protein
LSNTLDMVIEDTIDGCLESLSVGEAAHGQVFILDVTPERLMAPILLHILSSDTDKEME